MKKYNNLFKGSERFREQGRIGLSTLLIISLLVASGGFLQSFLINNAQAAQLTFVKGTLTTSAPNSSTSIDIRWVTNTAISGAADKTIILMFTDSASTTNPFVFRDSIGVADVDILTDTVDSTCGNLQQLRTGAFGAATSTDTWTAVFATSTDKLTLTYPGGSTTSTPASRCMSVRVGANATYNLTGQAFSNPVKSAGVGTADIDQVLIYGSLGDTGTAMMAIIEGVTVSATVNATLSFSMTGVTVGSCTGDSGTTPNVVDTSGASSTIPFGTLATVNKFYVGCHRLDVSTNAANGFATTIENNKPLKAASSSIPKTTCDAGACTNIATTTWASEANNGLGYSCENISGNGLCSNGTLPLGGVTSYRNISCTGGTGFDNCNAAVDTTQIFMSTSSPVSAQDVRIHYKISISGTQPAGSYSNTVTYIATPVF